MAKICVLGCYIKRRGNLLLLGEENKQIPAAELEHCIRESLENLRTSLEEMAANHSLTVEQMLKVLRPHPTFEEGLTDALEDLLAKLNK